MHSGWSERQQLCPRSVSLIFISSLISLEPISISCSVKALKVHSPYFLLPWLQKLECSPTGLASSKLQQKLAAVAWKASEADLNRSQKHSNSGSINFFRFAEAAIFSSGSTATRWSSDSSPSSRRGWRSEWYWRSSGSGSRGTRAASFNRAKLVVASAIIIFLNDDLDEAGLMNMHRSATRWHKLKVAHNLSVIHKTAKCEDTNRIVMLISHFINFKGFILAASLHSSIVTNLRATYSYP